MNNLGSILSQGELPAVVEKCLNHTKSYKNKPGIMQARVRFDAESSTAS